MFKYYIGVTLFIWIMLALAILFNKFVYKRGVAFDKGVSKEQKRINFIKFVIASMTPIIRISIFISIFKVLMYSNDKLKELAKNKSGY